MELIYTNIEEYQALINKAINLTKELDQVMEAIQNFEIKSEVKQ